MALAGSLGAVILTATPAAAADFNCFKWVQATAAHIVHPHPHPAQIAVHRATGAPRAHVHHARQVSRPARLHATPVNMIRKPIACPSHEVAMQSLPPGVAPPETAATLLAALAGPATPPSATDSAIDSSALAPAAPAPDIVSPNEVEGPVFPVIFGPGAGGPATSVVSLPGGVPEPGVWALLLVGFGAVGASLRNRRATSAALAR